MAFYVPCRWRLQGILKLYLLFIVLHLEHFISIPNCLPILSGLCVLTKPNSLLHFLHLNSILWDTSLWVSMHYGNNILLVAHQKLFPISFNFGA